nr:isocitrate lyase/phosphoenolpyruvate mutase family protein [Veronia nyctiphanis]
MLGYEDGEKIPFEELAYIVRRIVASTHLPLSVDIEGGYSRNPDVIASHLQTLAESGVVGVNIEDSVVTDDRRLQDVDVFCRLLEQIKESLQRGNINMFINVRCDTYILGIGNARAETELRARRYQAAGADGFFVPCLTDVEDIRAISSAITLPVNIMAMPNLPDFQALAQLGVQRLSAGNFMFDNSADYLSKQFEDVRSFDSYQPLFPS